MNVAVIGASDKKDRYSYKALMLLKEKGHTVFPVHQRLRKIEGIKVYSSIKNIKEPIDTISLYVSESVSGAIIDDILSKSPKRIIFSPGAENPELKRKAREKGIVAIDACTIVMLNTGQF